MNTPRCFLNVVLASIPMLLACPLSDPGDDDSGDDDRGDDDDGDGGSALGHRDESGTEGGDDDGSTAGATTDVCAAYCEVELTCDNYYPSVDACHTACSDDHDAAGECGDEYDAVYGCLGALACPEFGDFWDGLEALSNGEEPPPFACDAELYDYFVCLDDGGADEGDESAGTTEPGPEETSGGGGGDGPAPPGP